MNDDVVDRLAELAVVMSNNFDVKRFCTSPDGKLYRQQYASITDPSPFVTDVTTRRAGKTLGRAADHIATALETAESNSIYITLTRNNAKKIMFPVLLKINRDYRLGGEANISDLSLTMPNHSVIYCAGANDSQAIHNFRGMPKLKLVTIDEAQSMKEYIEELIDDVIGPGLIDEDGRLRVTGTPRAIPSGYFHRIAHSKNWKHHFYTMFDNVFLKDAKRRLELELRRRGVDINDPSIRREWFGEWALDVDALVLKYNPELNDYRELPKVRKWEYVIGVDLGYEDADAIGVIGFSEDLPDAYLIREQIDRKQTLTDLAMKLSPMVTKYQPLSIEVDTGGLGKKIAEELRRRFGIPVNAADKTRKIEHIELLNDAMRTRRFYAKKESTFAQDSMLMEWDREKSRGEKRVISDRFHSDIVDAVLYAFVKSLHWMHEKKPEKPKIGTQQYFREEEERIWEDQESRHQQEKEDQEFLRDPWE